MPCTTPPAPASSAKVWFCGELEKSYHFSADVPYTVKQPPIKDLRFKVPDKQFRMYEHDGAYTALPVCFNAAAAVDGVAYVIVSDGSNVFKPYIQSFHADGSTKFFPKKDKPCLYNLEVASLDRKIYIYGIDALMTKSSFEVFDTVNGTFEILPWISKSEDLKFKHMDTGIPRAVFAGNYLRLLGIDGCSKRIVFVGVAGFSFYYTESRKWESEAVAGFEPRSSLSISSDFGRCVVVGKRIYWLTERKQMMGYDFCERAYYESKALAEFQGTFPLDSELAGLDVVKATLLHINEEYFCLVWQSGFDMGYLFMTTLRVSSSTAKKSLTVSLLNTEKYQFDGFHHLNKKLALRLEPTEYLLMPGTMELDLEEFTESPAPPHHWDVPYPIVKHLSLTGDRFPSKKALSFWICGYTDEGKRACFFPIDLRVRECAESREVKRMRHDEILLNPIYFGTGGLEGCVHVALDGKIYNFGGRSIVENGDTLNPPENCIKVINKY